MPLSPGTRLGVYEVADRIGAGGMGEVYRARDTTLDRDVALKVLPDAFTSDPDRLARFEREARVLASLNHPNIGGIHGLEESDGVRALVLELVEGPTLADRIAQGPMAIDDVLQIATQIAHALEAAHAQGVIHRDLKPANIKVRPDGAVKVLDFGLAKALQPEAGDTAVTQSPTVSLTAAATRMGTVIGTAAYMAPEQAKGRVVDRRADVWAFGAVLYEMLTGQRPFGGDDVADTLALVLKFEPVWALLPADTPPRIIKVVQTCLQKDPTQRFHDVADVRLAMEGAFETTDGSSLAPTPPPLRIWQRPGGAAALALFVAAMAGAAAWAVTRTGDPPAGVTRFVIVPPESAPVARVGLRHSVAISPDGSRIVYSVLDEAGTQLTFRPIDQLDSTVLRAARGTAPFMSPDGESVGFVGRGTGRTLQSASISGGPAVTVAESVNFIYGASWGDDDRIVYGTSGGGGEVTGGGLFRVDAAGGEPETLTTIDTGRGETSHLWPFVIPGRDAVLFVISSGTPATTGRLAVLDLATGAVTPLGLAGVSPRYVATGHLVYAVEDGSVLAAPFDVSTLAVTGNPVALLEGVVVQASGAAEFAISDTGTLVYVRGEPESIDVSLDWVDREGQAVPLGAPPGRFFYPRISPDGTRVALEQRRDESEVWVWDLGRRNLSRVTFDDADDRAAHWTPDGGRLVFSSARDGVVGIYAKAADGTGAVERVAESTVTLFPNAVTPDGTRIVARAIDERNASDLVLVSREGSGATQPLLSTEFDELNAALSPDGAWMAFQSNASGRHEVYVRPFPDVERGQWLVSTDGGEEPAWAPDGRELFYRSGDALMVTPVHTDASFTHGTPRALFEGAYVRGGGRSYDVHPDGQRFLMSMRNRQSDAPPPPITVVLNWVEELQARVPVP